MKTIKFKANENIDKEFHYIDEEPTANHYYDIFYKLRNDKIDYIDYIIDKNNNIKQTIYHMK